MSDPKGVDKLVLFQKCYDFLLWLYPLVNRFPKHHRMVLGKRIEQLGLEIVSGVLKANNARGVLRFETQNELSEKIDDLRILFRLSKDLRFISIRQYTLGSKKVNELGKILSG